MADQQTITNYKREAGRYAADLVESNMVVGLGVGSTAIFAIERIAERLHHGELRDVVGIPCSDATRDHAQSLDIKLGTLDEFPVVDLTIDGADEVDPQFNLIKGGGGALLHEKIVAQATQRYVIIVDEGKRSPALGTNWALPVEVIPFGHETARAYLASIGAQPTLRMHADAPYRTDEGNYIYDAAFGAMHDPATIAAKLDSRAAIVEHGLFLGLASEIIVAGPNGIEHLRREA